MSSLAFIGEVLGYGNDGGACSPCGNRRQVVRTINGLYEDVTITIDGYTAVIEGHTIHFVGGAVGGTSNQVAGTEPIPNGAAEVAVVFDTPFVGVPIITGAEVIKADAADDDVTTWGIKNLTASGFTAVLSGAVENGNYVLHWEAQEAIAVIPSGDATFDSTTITFDSTLVTFDSA